MNRKRIGKKPKRNLCRAVIAFAIAVVFFMPGAVVFANDKGIEWDVTLNFKEINGKIDYVVFGEAPDANDGQSPDSYDMPKPPEPQPPYLRAWFDDGLPEEPYKKLWEDFRSYPDTRKIWELYVVWKCSSSNLTNITISWDTGGFIGCEYDSVVLWRYDPFDMEWDFAADMLVSNNYVYTPRWFNEQWLNDQFQIIASKPDNGNGDNDGNGDDGDNHGNGDNDENGDNGENPPINNPPTAFIDCLAIAYVNESITFDGANSTDDGTIIEYAWDFGDNHTGTEKIVNYTYLYSGNYVVLLVVTDDGGLSNTTSVDITILPMEEQNDHEDEDEDEEPDDNKEEKGTPGFEITVIIFAIAMFLFWKKKSNR